MDNASHYRCPLVRIGLFATTTARSRQTKDRYLFTRGLSTTRKNITAATSFFLLASRCDKGQSLFQPGPLSLLSSLLSSLLCSIALERFGLFGQSIPHCCVSQAYLEHPCPAPYQPSISSAQYQLRLSARQAVLGQERSIRWIPTTIPSSKLKTIPKDMSLSP